MSIASTLGIVHLPFGERPQYGSVYPEGLGVAHDDSPDDATGGVHSFTVLANPGFIYRLELFNYVRGEETVRVTTVISSHRWAADKSGLGNNSFDITWVAAGFSAGSGSGFSGYGLRNSAAANAHDVTDQIKRFPLGRLSGAPGVAQSIFFVSMLTNTDTISNDLALVFTYWDKQALFLPGFLSAFFEAPAAPPLVRSLF